MKRNIAAFLVRVEKHNPGLSKLFKGFEHSFFTNQVQMGRTLVCNLLFYKKREPFYLFSVCCGIFTAMC